MPGMSGEFIKWLNANGFCDGGPHCVNGLEYCSPLNCSIATMWPMIQVLEDNTIAIECIRGQLPPYGPPFTTLVRKPLQVPMSREDRVDYERQWSENQEITKLKERIVALEQRVTREQLIELAAREHDATCGCDPKYRMSCPRMAQAILNAGSKGEDSAT